MKKQKDDFLYDVAISFAGEERHIAEEIATKLISEKVKVYYDIFFEAELFGSVLPDKFLSVFSVESRYCLILITKNYINKKWTDYERQSALSRQIAQHGDYILPVIFKNGLLLPGLPDVIGYVKFSSTEKIVDLIVQKLFGVESDEKKKMEQQLKNLLSEINELNTIINYHAYDQGYSPDDDPEDDERGYCGDLESEFDSLLRKYREKYGKNPRWYNS
ncbi:MAG: hypothetical protein APF81_22885 [Desulfosporosinus sp. BRH_c37]|nr:MAG: hypothetical protein APF81_22885 [Desulfosporosinus sp. BRH_c37]